MTIALGITLAFVAMLAWGFGDFLIQKSTRRVGDWETLFIISLFGVVVLSPLVWHSFPALLLAGWSPMFALLLSGSVVLFFGAMLDFESLKVGKLAIVEPCWSIEIPSAAFLAFFILGERTSLEQVFIIIILMISLMMVGLRGRKFSKELLLEKGTLLALLAGIIMGAANFLMGWGGRVSDPIMVNFFTSLFLVIASGLFLLFKGRLRSTFSDLKHSYKLLLGMSLLDNIAWVAFIFSMSYAPIAIGTALSESYIIIAVLLGLYVSKEKLQTHQKFGLVGAIASAIVLAVITTN